MEVLEALIQSIQTSASHENLSGKMGEVIQFEVDESIDRVVRVTIGWSFPSPRIVITSREISIEGDITIRSHDGKVTKLSDLITLVDLLRRLNGGSIGNDYDLDA